MVSTAQPDHQQNLLMKLVGYCHNEWTQILQQANVNPNYLSTPETIKQLDQIIKINQKVASSVGKIYIQYLS